MALSGGCKLSQDCLKRNGTYCDRGTGRCEPCMDICNHLRDTMSECLEQITCKALWPVTEKDEPESPPSPSLSPSTSDEPSVVVTILVTMTIAVAVIVSIALIFTILWRKGKMQRFCPLRLKAPVQLSVERQKEEQTAQEQELVVLNSVAVDDGACANFAPELKHFTSTT